MHIVHVQYRRYDMAASRHEISLWVLEKYFMNERSKQFKYFWTQEEKFRSSKKPCNILFIT